MTNQPQPTKSPATAAAPTPPSPAPADLAPAIGMPRPVDELTPEEQMALFEKELKEKDWGHQPC